jgi:3-hydroxybutyryl-CoA dehydrogenase
MQFVVLAEDEDWDSLRNAAPGAEWKRMDDREAFLKEIGADAFFYLKDNCADTDYSNISSPVFIGSVTTTLSEMNAPENVIRINAWPGFIEKEIWEAAGKITPVAAAILKTLQKKYITVDDEPGLVSPRIIAMIINEAFFAKGEGVSSEEEIDIAMKLGTNYPYGPFEWARKIGLQNISALLQKLSAADNRYTPAPALQKELITF